MPMSAAYDFSPTQRPQRRKTRHSRNLTPVSSSTGQVIAFPTQKNDHKVSTIPTPSKQLPLWLRSLLWIQHSSAVVTFGLIGTTLLIYAVTVYSQQIWSREYRQLEELQRQERNLVATHESLKNQLAVEAQNEQAGLVSPHPNNTIFLSPSPNSPFKNRSESSSETSSLPEKTPLGY